MNNDLEFYQEKFKNIPHLFERGIRGRFHEKGLSGHVFPNVKVGKATIGGMKDFGDVNVLYGKHDQGVLGASTPSEILEVIEKGFLTVLETAPPEEILEYMNNKINGGSPHYLCYTIYNDNLYYCYQIFSKPDIIWDSEGKRVRKSSKLHKELEAIWCLEWKPVFPEPMDPTYYVYWESYEEMGFTYQDFLDGVRIRNLDKDESEWIVERS